MSNCKDCNCEMKYINENLFKNMKNTKNILCKKKLNFNFYDKEIIFKNSLLLSTFKKIFFKITGAPTQN